MECLCSGRREGKTTKIVERFLKTNSLLIVISSTEKTRIIEKSLL